MVEFSSLVKPSGRTLPTAAARGPSVSGAFWNPDRFYEIYHAAGWPAVVAHKRFSLDELLATGAIGLGLCLLLSGSLAYEHAWT
jgi:hypothetical protein